MTHYEFLSTIYTPDFMFFAGIANRSEETQIDFEASTIMGLISYDQADLQTMITNYWNVRRDYESQFSTTDLLMPDYIQDTISHSERQINLINNFLLAPENQIYG